MIHSLSSCEAHVKTEGSVESGAYIIKDRGVLCDVGTKAEKRFKLQTYGKTSQPNGRTQMKVAWISLRIKSTNKMDYGVHPKCNWND